MHIKGLQKTTLLDFPDRVAGTVFTGGCNFRCPVCDNASLVLSPSIVTEIPMEEFFSFIKKRKGILDGVCITGGEPLLQHDIIPFIERIKAEGYDVKLDTNGYRPDVLGDVLREELADYVAMDIKASPEKYAVTTGIKELDFSLIINSIELLEKSGIPHEFRTTVTEDFHTEEDFEKILSLFSESTPYYLQQFRDSGNLIDGGCRGWSTARMKSLHTELEKNHPNVHLREG